MDTTLALVPSNLLTASTTFQKQNVLEMSWLLSTLGIVFSFCFSYSWFSFFHLFWPFLNHDVWIPFSFANSIAYQKSVLLITCNFINYSLSLSLCLSLSQLTSQYYIPLWCSFSKWSVTPYVLSISFWISALTHCHFLFIRR